MTAEGVELVELRAEIVRLRASIENLDALYVSRTDGLREAEAEVARLRGALRNVLLLTMQRRPYMPEDVSEKLLRFCREGGEGPSILRLPVDHAADARFSAEKAASPPFREKKP